MENIKIWILLLSLIFISFTSISHAESVTVVTGRDVYTACQKKLEYTANIQQTYEDKRQAGICNGLMKGIDDMQILLASKYRKFVHTRKIYFYCITEGTSMDEMAQQYINYMNNHPEDMNQPAGISILEALKEAYPCKGH
jgi:hypothetical protein